MPFFSLLAKLPWQLLLSKAPDIIKTVNTLRGKPEEKTFEETLQYDFFALEKLVVEHAKISVNSARQIAELRVEVEALRKKLSLLVSLTAALAVTVLILIVVNITLAG
ncbi:MAG: hypothetical protein COT17_01490 [Elusimicrobia bacterium CG08_land_8_20_14_0_20_51_18]|nr:MAG: hypothetical protein COT17_01490 [Elusimicrobia bacterium CG08_land_8_20_14_0_20_51_18]